MNTLLQLLRGNALKIIIPLVILLIVLLNVNPFAVNDSGYRTHVQTLSGKEWVRFQPGFYFAGFFSKRTEYPNVITTIFNREVDNDVTASEAPIEIRFNDATRATAEATVKWRLPNDEASMVELHKEFRTSKRVATGSLVPYARECLLFAAQLMESETHYSGGQSKLKEDFRSQLQDGQYVLEQKTEYVIDTLTSEPRKITTTFIRMNDDGTEKRIKSDIHQYNIDVAFAAVDKVDYEEQVDEKLAQKIEASTRESISKQKLITAQQEALTAKEEGAKLIAETRATEEASKVEAVIRAERAKEVAREEAEQAMFVADKIEEEGRAQAAANRALVEAGLTPEQQMQLDIKIAEVVSQNVAKASTPSVVIMGGEGGGGADDVMSIFGAERSLELISKIKSAK